MSDPSSNPADVDELQFDKAEYAEETGDAGPTCAACHGVISDHYYQLNGAILCDPCRVFVMEKIGGGSSFLRFLKACLFGSGAAVGGFAIYFGVLKITGMEIGLISILVGFLVGMAVRTGSEGRGGVLYQLIAIFFTYLAIAASYSAHILPDHFAKFEAERAKAQAGPKDPAKAEVKKAAGDQPVEKVDAPVEPTLFALVFSIVIILAILFALALALPIEIGFSSPIGLLIIAFALWEAYKINRKTPFVITGPHHVGPGPLMAQVHA